MSLVVTGFNQRKNKGFSLLEAMIGFFVLSVGMLGIASLQSLSLKAGKTSSYGSVASMKVDELFESMRANPGSLSTYEGSGANNGCTAVKNCTAAELAAEDVFWWKKNLTAGLPAAATTVVAVTNPVAPSKMATVSVTINWVERDSKIDSSTATATAKNSTGIAKTYSITSNICTENPC